MTTSFLARGEGRIAYETTGTGPLVLLLHGMGIDRSVWRFTVPALVAAGLRVVTMDLRGHGESDATFTSYDDQAAADDALALLAHLGDQPALVVGHSMCGGAAVIAAAQRPAAVAGLALVAPFVRNPGGNPLGPMILRLALAKPWGPAVWRSFYRGYYPSRVPADFDESTAAALSRLRPHWSAFERTARTDHTTARDRLAAVTAPTLVIMGTKDRDWPDPVAEGRFIAETLHGELSLVDGAGHYPMAEFPEVVNPTLVDWCLGRG